MALLDYELGYGGAAQPLAQPTVSETISSPDRGTFLEVTVGGTATVITIVRPGTDAVGVAITDQVSASLSNTTRKWLVDNNYANDENNATVTFSQVTGVTAAVFRAPS